MDFILVWEADGGQIGVSLDDEMQLDQAVSTYLDTGRDSLLYLTTRADCKYVTLASHIVSWGISTQEGRRREAEIQSTLLKEQQALQWENDLPDLRDI